MKTYEEMVREYASRQKDTLVDTITTGLTYADNVAVDSGLLEETGLLPELTSSALTALPFVLIAFVEGSKVILGRKPARTGTKDALRRIVKTGTALGVGALVSGAVGIWAAIPASMGSRMIFDKYKSKTMQNVRIASRITRLREMNENLRSKGEAARPAKDTDDMDIVAVVE
ncbi:MAG: hypothetical protein IJ246_01305 [Clostridia bacterium]|nr:hypothetical protein [Clostridia bacterium]